MELNLPLLHCTFTVVITVHIWCMFLFSPGLADEPWEQHRQAPVLQQLSYSSQALAAAQSGIASV